MVLDKVFQFGNFVMLLDSMNATGFRAGHFTSTGGFWSFCFSSLGQKWGVLVLAR